MYIESCPPQLRRESNSSMVLVEQAAWIADGIASFARDTRAQPARGGGTRHKLSGGSLVSSPFSNTSETLSVRTVDFSRWLMEHVRRSRPPPDPPPSMYTFCVRHSPNHLATPRRYPTSLPVHSSPDLSTRRSVLSRVAVWLSVHAAVALWTRRVPRSSPAPRRCRRHRRSSP